MSSNDSPRRSALAGLRQFVNRRTADERCDLCGASLPSVHPHLIESGRRRLFCACDPCAILFSANPDARYRRVPRRFETLADFRLSDAQWEDLHLPINLVFFVPGAHDGPARAFYPSPAGAIESLHSLENWHILLRENPILNDLEPDVEALLVNRIGQARDHYRVPIDECYKLVGLIRSRWHGLSGGSEVWADVERFFDCLKARSAPPGGSTHA